MKFLFVFHMQLNLSSSAKSCQLQSLFSQAVVGISYAAHPPHSCASAPAQQHIPTSHFTAEETKQGRNMAGTTPYLAPGETHKIISFR